MTTAIATRPGDSLALDGDKVELLRRTICKGSTDDEFELFLGVCRRTGLDPFAKQIHAVKRWNFLAGREEMSIQVGIDGFRLVAERTGHLDGQDGPYWCGPDGVWQDVWTGDGFPFAAKVIVFRKGCSRPFSAVAKWSEYVQTKKDGKPNRMWGGMGSNQLAKCAEALALRKGFPQELAGLYTMDEMGQAANGADSDADGPRLADAEPAREEPAKALPATTTPPAKEVAATAPTLAEKIAELVIQGDPVTDVKAFNALCLAKDLKWPDVVNSANKRYGAKYTLTRTRWLDVAKEHRVEMVKKIGGMPDVNGLAVQPPPEPKQDGPRGVLSSNDVEGMIAQWAILTNRSLAEALRLVFQLLRLDAGCLDDLSQADLKRCAEYAAKGVHEANENKGVKK